MNLSSQFDLIARELKITREELDKMTLAEVAGRRLGALPDRARSLATSLRELHEGRIWIEHSLVVDGPKSRESWRADLWDGNEIAASFEGEPADILVSACNWGAAETQRAADAIAEDQP